MLAAYGRLDYAHNNAGIIEGQLSIHEYPDDQWDRIIANNLTSVFLCLKHEIPVMLAQGGGAIVNVASETTYKGNAGDAAYTASKHGVWGLTTVAALRYVKRGIRVNAIAPGNVRTGITERAQAVTPPEIWEHIERANPIGRLIEPRGDRRAGRLALLRPGRPGQRHPGRRRHRLARRLRGSAARLLAEGAQRCMVRSSGEIRTLYMASVGMRACRTELRLMMSESTGVPFRAGFDHATSSRACR